MKKTFQKWLLGVVLTAFIFTFIGAYIVQTVLSRRAAEIFLKIKLNDACAQLDNACRNYEKLARITKEKTLVHADYLALWLKHQPACIHNPKELDGLRNILKASQLRIFDAAGKQIAASPENLKPDRLPASVLNSGRQARLSITHKFRLADNNEDVEHNVYRYLPGSSGFIFLKFYSHSLNKAFDDTDIKLFAEGFRIGSGGGMIIAKGNDILCDGTLNIKESKLSELNLLTDSNIKTYNAIIIDKIAYFGLRRKYRQYSIIGVLPLSELYKHRNQLLLLLAVGHIILFSFIFWAIAALLEHKVIKGITRICASLNKITAGDLHAKANVHSSPEFIQLSCGINSTVNALREAIDEAGRRHENELKLAAAIQASALPRVDSLEPYPDGIELCATMTAAREVGGDFYDFFWIDDKKFAFLIADVSEKGIPAALFMMSAKTWIKSLAKSHLEPAAVFTEANRMLCFDNDTGMFVTVFFGILELDSGKLTCINAGHNPPLLKRAGENYEFLRIEPDFILGTLPEAEYQQTELRLAAGDRLFLYTDGVTEAINSEEEEFGNRRLLESLEQFNSDKPEKLVKHIHDQVRKFSGACPQYDDITMLILDYAGAPLVLNANIEELPKLQNYLEQSCMRHNIAVNIESQLQIAAEEVFLNIVNYAYENENGTMSILFNCIPEKRSAQLIFTDSGKPYNPQLADIPNLSEDADDRQPGGLGVFLIKELIDTMDYERNNNKNILTLTKATG